MSEMNRFNLVRNGYDCFQVNNEISRLEFQIKSLNEKIVTYQTQIDTVNTQFAIIKKRYQQLVSELNMREKAADDVARIALKEANSIIENAQNNADAIVNEAMVTAQKLLDEARAYNDKTFDTRTQITEALEGFIAALKEDEKPSIPDLEENQ